MMQKFGYKVGTGLGKQSQGITTPLIIKKTTDTACRIEPSSIPLNHFISADTSARNALAANGIAITSVVVFVGLLSLEELTDELEKELRIECELYGMVSKWMIFLFGEELRIFAAY